jgi:hypothetical protein
MDSGLVYFLDSAYGPGRWGDVTRREGNDKRTLNVYEAIVKYNAYMGGVDAWDALRTGYFAIEMIGRLARWTVRFVDGMFNFSLTQAWVAYRYNNKESAHHGRLEFMTAIMKAFLRNTFDQDAGVHKPLTRAQETFAFDHIHAYTLSPPC